MNALVPKGMAELLAGQNSTLPYMQRDPSGLDWWQNRLRNMPNASGNFSDSIFAQPVDPAARNSMDFDPMVMSEQPITQEWLARGNRPVQLPRIK